MPGWRAMDRAARHEEWALPWAPALFGVWAAAIAMAPGILAKAAAGGASAGFSCACGGRCRVPRAGSALFFGASLLLPPLADSHRRFRAASGIALRRRSDCSPACSGCPIGGSCRAV